MPINPIPIAHRPPGSVGGTVSGGPPANIHVGPFGFGLPHISLPGREIAVRIFEVIFGGILILIGVATLFSQTKPGKAIIRNAPKGLLAL